MAQKIADGVYNAIPTAAAVYEKNNMLKLEVHFTLCDEEGNAYTQTGSDGNEYPIEKYKYYVLVNAQGAVNTKVVDGIVSWAKGWDATDPYWWADAANVDAIGMVEVTLKTAPAYNDPSKTYQNVEWVNELGHSASHGGGSKAIQSGDRAAIMAKYGAKFKAAFGATPKPVGGRPAPKPVGASAPTARPTAAPKAKTPPTAPQAQGAEGAQPQASQFADGTAGANAVWDAFENNTPAMSKADREEKWFAAINKHSDGKDQKDMTGDQWAKVAQELFGDLGIDPDDLPF